MKKLIITEEDNGRINCTSSGFSEVELIGLFRTQSLFAENLVMSRMVDNLGDKQPHEPTIKDLLNEDLSVRAKNCINTALYYGLNENVELKSLTKRKMLSWRMMGKKSLNEVSDILNEKFNIIIPNK